MPSKIEGNRPDVLQHAEVQVWSNRECQASFDEQNKAQTIRPTQMCAGRKMGGVDACWVSIQYYTCYSSLESNRWPNGHLEYMWTPNSAEYLRRKKAQIFTTKVVFFMKKFFFQFFSKVGKVSTSKNVSIFIKIDHFLLIFSFLKKCLNFSNRLCVNRSVFRRCTLNIRTKTNMHKFKSKLFSWTHQTDNKTSSIVNRLIRVVQWYRMKMV